MTELVLIRHGETDWNRERRIQGHTDTPLSDLGRAQARLTARRLAALHAERPFTRILSSDLARVVQTATPAAEALGLPLECLACWRERAFGVLEGHRLAEVDAALPEVAARWRSREPGYVIPGGESLDAFRDRVRDSVESLRAIAPGERVLVFTHGGVLDMAFRLATGIGVQPRREHPILNASINTVLGVVDGWEILAWGDVDHLAELARAVEGDAGAAPGGDGLEVAAGVR